MIAATQVKATFDAKKGFICTNGNHVLYCPDLATANSTQPFFLYCAKHNSMYEIDLATQGEEFIKEFPRGCKAT